jgi:hypothetical protein
MPAIPDNKVCMHTVALMGRRSVTPSSDTRSSHSSDVWANNFNFGAEVTPTGGMFKGESASGSFVPSRQRSSGLMGGVGKVSLKDQIIPPLADADLRLKGARRLAEATMRERNASAASMSAAGERVATFSDIKPEGGMHDDTLQHHERSVYSRDSSVAPEPPVPAMQGNATGVPASGDASESHEQFTDGVAHRDFALRAPQPQREAHDDLIDAVVAVAKDDEDVGHALKQVSVHGIISFRRFVFVHEHVGR